IHKKGNLGDYYLSEWVYNESTKKGESPFNYLKIEDGKGIILTRGNAQVGIKRLDAFKQNELVLRQISDPDMYFPLYTLKQAIEQIIVYNYFDTTFDSAIRQLSPFYAETKLLNDGRNLVHLLNYLSTSETEAYDQIINLLRTHINPNFEDLRFLVQGSKMLLSLKERGLSRTVTVDHISDGTLRFLLLLSIFYNPNRGSIICIDEPETGLHPDMINTVAKAIKHASQNGSQIIIATHSPLLLNNFELEDLRIFEKDSLNQSIVSSINEKDFPDWEGEFIVGQMWIRGQLGGVRW
ncbi:MAG: AAA family ATPase, partial [Bacteroidota bacterium]|nr:AAA family ATPase [Bacteroidota bacterium]